MQLKKSFYVLEGVGLYNQALALLAPSTERETSEDFLTEREKGKGGGAPRGAGDACAAVASKGEDTSGAAAAAADSEKTGKETAAAAVAAAPQPPSAENEDSDDTPPPPTPEEIAAMRATLLSNRAQAHLVLGNDRRALSDALGATASDPKMTKAHFRAARAALRLREWRACESAIRAGTESVVDEDKASKGVLADFEALSLSLAKSESEALSAEKARLESEALARAPSLSLARLLVEQRKWRIGYPQLSVGAARNKPWAVDGVVHWPLVFVYPESGATDAVEVASELEPISAHLDSMFGSFDDGESSTSSSSSGVPPLPWDEAGAYRNRKDIELYYLSHATEPLPNLEALVDVFHRGWPEGLKAVPPQRHGPRAAKAVKVDERKTLGEILSRGDFVVPGIPAFFVVSKSKKGRAAEVRRRFLEENG